MIVPGPPPVNGGMRLGSPHNRSSPNDRGAKDDQPGGARGEGMSLFQRRRGMFLQRLAQFDLVLVPHGAAAHRELANSAEQQTAAP